MSDKKPSDFTRLGCGVVILSPDQQRVLLLNAVKQGEWTRPGGAVEPLETMEAAAYREVEEEVGLPPAALSSMRLVHLQEGARVAEKPIPWVAAGFVAVLAPEHCDAAVNREPAKHTEMRWWPMADVFTTEEPVNGFTRATLRAVLDEATAGGFGSVVA